MRNRRERLPLDGLLIVLVTVGVALLVRTVLGDLKAGAVQAAGIRQKLWEHGHPCPEE